MAAEGGAESQNLIPMLLEIEEHGRSGLLRFQRGNQKRQLAIRSGRLASAESSVPEEHLARVLLEQESITRGDLLEIAKLMRKGMRSDEAALALGTVAAAAVSAGLRQQAVQIGTALLVAPGASARFYPDLAPERAAALDLPLADFALECARRAAAEAPISFAPGSQVSAGPTARRAARFQLDAAEAALWVRVENGAALAALLSSAARGGARPEELLRRLVLLGLATVTRGETLAPGPRPPDPLLARIEDLLRRFEVANHYEILGAETNATPEQIQGAYHELAKEFHPDRFQAADVDPLLRRQAERLFTVINEAYTTLSDAALRYKYDEDRTSDERSRVEATLRARAGGDADTDQMAETLYRAGRKALSNRDFETAVSRLKECVWLRPDVVRYRHFLGIGQSEIPRLRKEAEEHLLRAIALDPMAIDSHLALGRLYVKVALKHRAEIQLREVLRWDPSNAEAQRLLDSLKARPR